MDRREKQIRQKLKDDFEHYATKCLKIRTKDGNIRPFILNKAQIYIHKKLTKQLEKSGKIRTIILKGRQQGCSTYAEGRFYWRVTHLRGVRAFILTHDQEATNNLFELAQRFHANCPELVKPVAGSHNAKEMDFPSLDSGYKVGTAGNKGVGRSSTLQFFHGSEVAFWPNATEHAKGILQAIPNSPGTEVILESTANGIGNYFHQQWQLATAGESAYEPIFVPWYWQDEYHEEPGEDFQLTDEEKEISALHGLKPSQLRWRRTKIQEFSVSGLDGAKAFQQEYPLDAVEAFQTSGTDSFIEPNLVMTARKGKAEKYGPVIIGVDPARFGDDKTAFIKRQGRVAYDLQTFEKKDTMEIAGMVHKMLRDIAGSYAMIDVGGLGAGVVDRLREMGYHDRLKAVNSGSKPFDKQRYLNKRAEMWSEMKLWLGEEPVQIPDNDNLHADLCGLSYKFDSNTRLVLEKKEDLKKRGLRSPDTADALALTFAYPVVTQAIDIKYFMNPTIRI